MKISHWNLFNRPVVMFLLMAVALFSFLIVQFDGFQKRHVHIPYLYEEVKFLKDEAKFAFLRQSEDWLTQSGYEFSEKGWREVTGKAAASQGSGVREDLRVYVKRVSARSYQAWGIGEPSDTFTLTQVYRAMYVSEYTQEKADAFRDAFEKDAKRLRNLAGIGRRL